LEYGQAPTAVGSEIVVVLVEIAVTMVGIMIWAGSVQMTSCFISTYNRCVVYCLQDRAGQHGRNDVDCHNNGSHVDLASVGYRGVRVCDLSISRPNCDCGHPSSRDTRCLSHIDCGGSC